MALGTPLTTTATNKPIDITPTDTPAATVAPITELTPVGTHLSDLASTSDSPIHEVVSIPVQPQPTATTPENPTSTASVTPSPQVESITPVAAVAPTIAPSSATEPLTITSTPTLTPTLTPAPQTPAAPFAEDPNLVKTI